MKDNEGIASPLPPRRIHPRHKWRGILRGSHNQWCFAFKAMITFAAKYIDTNGSHGV
jgi:hypothetical protein